MIIVVSVLLYYPVQTRMSELFNVRSYDNICTLVNEKDNICLFLCDSGVCLCLAQLMPALLDSSTS